MDLAGDTYANLASPQQRMQAVPVQCANHSDDFGWQGFRIEDYPDLPESDFLSPAMNHHLLVFHYKSMDGEFIHNCAGRRTVTRIRAGQVSFIPAGADNHWAFGDGKPSALHILIDAKCFDEAIANPGTELRDNFQVTSKPLERMAKRLQRELDFHGVTGPLFGDSMLQLVSEEVQSIFGVDRIAREFANCNVSAARDLIEAEFERNISLRELAGLCNLSQSQLMRQFRRQFGATPHQFLLRKRVEVAKRMLLTDREIPLALVASSLGYSDQSHFTRQFARTTGITPQKYRMPM